MPRDAASAAAQSDPAMNPMFSRIWDDPPNDERRPGQGAALDLGSTLKKTCERTRRASAKQLLSIVEMQLRLRWGL
jgi:hypothetical protein